MKTCTKCGVTKDLSCFGKDKYKNSGLKSACKECYSSEDKARYWKDPDKARKRVKDERNKAKRNNPELVKLKDRNTKLKRAYGMSIEDYTEMLINQNYRCSVCEVHSDESGHHGKLVVDHCHNTGKVRSLLCNKCNTALGLLNENISIMESLIKYVKAHQ